MDKAKVVHISTVHYWQDARILYKECISLSRSGYDVRLFIQHEGEREVEGVKIEGLPVAGNKLHRLTRVIPKMIAKVMACDRDVLLHLHDPELLLFGMLFKVLGYKVIYDVHEDLPKDVLDKEWIPAGLRKPFSWLIRLIEFLATAAFDAVIYVAPGTADRFQHVEHAMVCNYPKLDLFLKEDPQPGGDYAVYVGDIRDVRGALEMVRAINMTKADLRLKMGGRIYPSDYNMELENADTQARMDLLGWVSHDEIPVLLKKALAGLVVLHPLEGYMEAYSVKMFEYMAAGIPVISSDFPVWREIIEDAGCGILVDPLKPKAIAGALDHLSSHPEEAKAMGARGRKAAREKYNWEKEEEKLLELYSRVLGRV